jgi:Protein of unknown function (DUF2892)
MARRAASMARLRKWVNPFVRFRLFPHERRTAMNGFFATNEGAIDRILRIALGFTLLALVFVGPKTLWGAFGIVPLVTGIAGTCPVYSLLGIRTCPMKRHS